MTARTVVLAFFDAPRIKNGRRGFKGSIHGIVSPRRGDRTRAVEIPGTISTEFLRLRIPPERGPQPPPLDLMDQMESHQYREIAARSAVIPFSGIQANPEKLGQGNICRIRGCGLARIRGRSARRSFRSAVFGYYDPEFSGAHLIARSSRHLYDLAVLKARRPPNSVPKCGGQVRTIQESQCNRRRLAFPRRECTIQRQVSRSGEQRRAHPDRHFRAVMETLVQKITGRCFRHYSARRIAARKDLANSRPGDELGNTFASSAFLD